MPTTKNRTIRTAVIVALSFTLASMPTSVLAQNSAPSGPITWPQIIAFCSALIVVQTFVLGIIGIVGFRWAMKDRKESQVQKNEQMERRRVTDFLGSDEWRKKQRDDLKDTLTLIFANNEVKIPVDRTMETSLSERFTELKKTLTAELPEMVAKEVISQVRKAKVEIYEHVDEKIDAEKG